MEPLKLKPAIQDYIWGGTRLRDEFGKESDLERLAESWELSCHPAGQAVIMNSVNKGLTLKEYLEDYARPETKRVGEALIQRELAHIPNEKVRNIVVERLEKIREGSRDFRF